MTPQRRQRRAELALERREDEAADRAFKERFAKMFPTSTQKPMVAKAPAPTFDQVLTLLIGAFEKKLEARRRDEAERAAAVEREHMENIATLEPPVAAAARRIGRPLANEQGSRQVIERSSARAFGSEIEATSQTN